MKTKICILVLVCLAAMGILNAQTEAPSTYHPTFDVSYWNAYADKLHLNAAEKEEFIASHKKNNSVFLQQQSAPAPVSGQRSGSPNSTLAGNCINIDFESGNLSNWVATKGYNPLYTGNTSGCCLNPGGQQAIMSGAGLDPAGGFPVVCPGGTYSLRLGSSATGGLADRVEQTFMVTAANANFTYKYAVVLEDPGHTPTQQPSFQIEMLDSTGSQIPCTYYSVTAAGNIPGFLNSATMANVRYKPWSSVVADLTALIGQNVTIRFTTYDCSLGGHFGYAYIDGSCLAFMKTSNDTICAGTQTTYCAPSGFLSTTWNGPGMVNNTNQCVSVSAPGVYTCQTVLIPGCPGPDFTYTLSNYPKPVVSFNAVSSSACSPQYTFANTSGISSGVISNYAWMFNNNSTSSAVNPAHTFPAAGSYTIRLIASSNFGCKDTAVQNLTIYPFPAVNFTAPGSCIGSSVSFANASTISSGSISSYNWNFGNNATSTLASPAVTYTNSGSYVVSLSATSNQSCVSTQTSNLQIYPKPTASFNSSAQSACAQQYTFSNTSSISSGSISSYSWNFGNGSSSLQNPVYSFAAPGNYTVSMIAVSNQSCRDTAYKSLAIYPFPTVNFSAPASCLNSGLNPINTSSISLGSITSYSWSFGNGNGSTAVSPMVTYAGSGTYLVTLSAVSNQNCVSTATANAVVYPSPQVSLMVNNLCFGSSTNFYNSSSVITGSIVSGVWDFGDGTTSSASNPSHTYSTTGTYNASLLVVSNQNCVSTGSTNVTINPLPVISYNVSNVCHGNSTLFSNTSSIASGSINTYFWNFGNNTSSGLNSPSMVYLNPGSYVVMLTATSSQSCAATATSNVVIHPVPALSFSATNVCLGDNTQFTNSSSISSGTISAYSWTFGDGGTGISGNPSHTYGNYGSYPVTLSAISNQNCTSSYSSTLVIHPLPVIAFSSSNVCLGIASTFTNNSSIASGNLGSWLWNFGSSQPASTLQNPTNLYGGTGAYTVSLQGTSNKGCKSSSTRVVNVYANPTASFVSKNVCYSEASTFADASTVQAPDQITSYNWDFGNGQAANTPNPSLTYTTGAIYPVKLVVTTNNGCSRQYIAPVTVYHLPQVNFSPSYACRNQATQFVNSTTIASGTMARCRWDFEGDGIWDDTVSINPVKTYPGHGVYNCRLEVQSSYQCTGAKTNNVTVYANPVANFSAKAVCLGDVTTFSNQSTSVDGVIASYQWDFNGDNIVDNISPSPSITYSANGTYLVRLEVQTQYGCTHVKSKSGHINAKPVAAFTSKNNKACPGLPVNFNNASFIATGSIVTTQWLFGDGTLPDYSANPSHLFEPGTYSVTLKLVSDSGCITSFVNPDFVTIYPKPTAGFKVDPEEIDENDPVMNIKSSAQNAVWTHYFVNDGFSAGTENFIHTFKNITQAKPMIVQVVKNEYNCADTIQELLKVKPAFVIYIPNTFTPNGDGLNDGFQAKGVGITRFSIQIFDRWGHMLYETHDIENAWDGTAKGSADPIKEDTYVWKAKVVDLLNKTHDLSGHVSLIR